MIEQHMGLSSPYINHVGKHKSILQIFAMYIKATNPEINKGTMAAMAMKPTKVQSVPMHPTIVSCKIYHERMDAMTMYDEFPVQE